jgi:hypothetical protein
MQVDFFAILEDSKTIKLYDVSPSGQSLPLNIYSMTLNITSSVIPDGMIDNKLDILAYLSNQRIQKEIYTVTSEILGFANSIDIPDGVYHFFYDVNNTDVKERVFLVYQTVEAATNEMLEAVNYNIEIGDYDIEYVGDTSEYDIEKVRLAVTLLDSLKEQAKLPDEVKVNDTLDKLTRLLEIINEDINNN